MDLIQTMSKDLPWLNVPKNGHDFQSSYRLLFYFWSMSCPYCSELTDQLLEETVNLETFQVIAVHVPYTVEEKSLELVKTRVEEKKITIPVVLDQNYEIAQSFGIQGIPAFCLVNQQMKKELLTMGEEGFHKMMKKIKQLK